MQSSSRIELVRYAASHAPAWNAFLESARNPHFFFHRDYVEYHSDRFDDCSLLALANSVPVALLPANIRGDTVFSHQGLSFGGFVSGPEMSGTLMLELFAQLARYLPTIGVQRLEYRPMPHIYHLAPAEEDLYALFRLGARLTRRDLGSAVQPGRLRYSKGKRHNIAKARKRSLAFRRTSDYAWFMSLLANVLENRHAVKPTHTLQEITLLAKRFPDNIRLYAAHSLDQPVAGALLYINRTVAHAQYLANSPAGRDFGALDCLLDWLIETEFPDKAYFSFGVSTQQQGLELNEGLLHSKEAFGARAIVHDFYEIPL